MLRNNLTRSILILLLLMISIPLGYSFYTGGESIFPTNDVIVTSTSTHVISTAISPTHTSEIRQSETPYSDVSPTYMITPLTTPIIYDTLTPISINSEGNLTRKKNE